MTDSAQANGLNSLERRVTAVLAGVYGVRMLGLFLLLPVLALYAADLPGATPLLIGLAVGVYGITQATLQVPFGILSDRIGRKPVILFGLLIFIAGSVIAARSDSMAVLIAGRAIQGAGAISAAITALLADHTRAEFRTRAMAIVGVTIGVSFMVSLMLGPVLANIWGVAGLFWLAAILGVAAMLLVGFGVTAAPRQLAGSGNLAAGLADRRLRLLYGGVFVLHLALTGLFVALPLMLREELGFAADQHWKLYLTSMLLSLLGTVPMIMLSERQRQSAGAGVLTAAVLLVAGGQLVLYTGLGGLTGIGIGLILFFAGFNFLEARMPALLSILAAAESRGASLGIYATSQFLGAFAGGVLAGIVMSDGGTGMVYATGAGMLAAWWLLGKIMNIRLFEPNSGVLKSR
ncbi:MAG: MFS transporter [Gammaproteobacteria bacterium]